MGFIYGHWFYFQIQNFADSLMRSYSLFYSLSCLRGGLALFYPLLQFLFSMCFFLLCEQYAILLCLKTVFFFISADKTFCYVRRIINCEEGCPLLYKITVMY